MALDELDEVIEVRLILQTQRRGMRPLGLVHRVLVERFGGGNAVAALEEPRHCPPGRSGFRRGISRNGLLGMDILSFIVRRWPPGCHPHRIGSRSQSV